VVSKEMPAQISLQRSKRRWWQVVSRAVALGLLVLAGAYVTLPFWAPSGLLRRWLAGQLSQQIGVEVRIEGVSLSWSRGVELSGLTIASPRGFGPEPLAVVERIRAELAPMNMLFRGKLEWMELENARLFARIDEAGKNNLEPFGKLLSPLEIDRVGIRQAAATLKLPGRKRPIRLDISDFQFLAGRRHRLGRITMSAGLVQSGSHAPLSLHLSATGGAKQIAARAAVNFTNVELGQLALGEILKLPVSKLAGQCSGLLELQVNSQAVVDRFGLNLTIRRLDVQPRTGPRLPVIDEASLRISAAYDPLSGKLELQSASVRIPGVDLAGRATIFTDIRGGHWEAIESVDLKGVLRPLPLLALLTGRASGPGELVVDGPVNVQLGARRSGARVAVNLAADASSALLRRSGRLIKPAGRALSMELSGSFDWRNRRFAAERTALAIGKNRFAGTGTLDDVRRLIGRWAEAGRQTSLPQTVLEQLAHLDWVGSWEIRELDSLRELWPPLAAALKDVDLRGVITGDYSIGNSASEQVRLGLKIPAPTHLAVAGTFVKPPAAEINLKLAGTIDAAQPGLKDLDIALTVGQGHLHVDRGYLSFSDGGEARIPSMTVVSEGGFQAEKLRAMLACFPKAVQNQLDLSGVINGQYAMRLGREASEVTIKADLAGLGLAWAEVFCKPAGQPGTIQIDLLPNRIGQSAGANSLAMTWGCPDAKIVATAVFPGPGGDDHISQGTLQAHAEIKNARWCVQSAPLLREYLSEAKLAGPLRVDASASWGGRKLELDVGCNADGVEYVSSGRLRRVKPAGVPLRIHLTGSLQKTAGYAMTVDVRRAAMDIAESRLSLCGRAILDTERPGSNEKLRPLRAVKQLNATINTSCVINEQLCKLLPELAELVGECELAGSFDAATNVNTDGESVSIRSHIDAGRLSAGRLGPFALSWRAPEAKDSTIKLGPFIKPAGMNAEAELEITTPVDLSQMHVNNLHARVGGLGLLASGKLDVTVGPNGLPESLNLRRTQLSIGTKHAETLHQMAPALKQYQLAGDGFLEMTWTDAAGGRISHAAINAGRLTGMYRGKNVAVAGSVLLERLDLRRGALPEIGAVKTDGLEFRIGDNHGWVIADIVNLLKNPAGTFCVLVEDLNDKDLLDWFVPPDAPPERKRKLTAEDTEELLRRCERKVSDVQKYLGAASLAGRVSINRLKTFDASVQRFYEARHVELDAQTDAGLATIRYAAGLNGGSIRARHDIRLTDAIPAVTSQVELRGVTATPNIQPQLAKYFPGNTVYGYFNRTEKITVPLCDLLANATDWRYSLRPVGTGKTVTTDGLLEGRAAPRFITRIFPGLNLTKYKYNKMTAFAEYRPNGLAVNDMIFSGRKYDIYMEGTTDVQNIGRYEIGLILLGSPQSAEWNHAWKQGRVPILKLKARIEGGKLYDEEVTYPWPNETLGVMLLKNNIFYRIWLNMRNKK